MKEGQLFAVSPLSWCPHLEEHVRVGNDNTRWGLEIPCSCCGDQSENWVCLSCYQVR